MTSALNLDQPTHRPEWLNGADRSAAFAEDGVAMTSDFACGNGQSFQRIGPREYAFRSRVARQPYSYRFFFRIDGAAAGRPLRFRVTDFKMIDPPMPERDRAVMLSYDQRNWRALAQSAVRTLPGVCDAEADYRDSGRAYSVQYEFTPERFPVWFASPLPFTVEDFRALLDDMAAQPGWEEAPLGKTGYGLDIPVIRFQGSETPEHTIFYTSGQHPSEVGGVMGLVGALEAFLELDPRMRSRLAFHAVPMVCMDGWLFGRSVHNADDEVGVNLNRDWLEPAAAETRAAIGALRAAQPDVLVDSHNGRGDTVCRFQEYGLTPESRGFWEAVATEFESPQGPPLLKDRDVQTLCSVEALRSGLAKTAVTFENVLTVAPSRETYLANGRALLRAIARTLFREKD